MDRTVLNERNTVRSSADQVQSPGSLTGNTVNSYIVERLILQRSLTNSVCKTTIEYRSATFFTQAVAALGSTVASTL